MTATTLTATENNGGRQPDYFIAASGIPRLVGFSGRKMNRNSPAPVGTDPSKLNKCLYNLTVRNGGTGGSRNGSKIESDIAIRNQYSSKSNSSTSVSHKHRSSHSSTGTALSISSASLASWPSSSSTSKTAVMITGRLGTNRRNSVTSSHISSPMPSSFIPTSGNFNHNLGSCSRIASVVGRGRPHSTLLGERQRRNVAGMGNSNRLDDGHFGGNQTMRQCRFTVAVRKTPSSTADNRLNYQRKYDRTIFGYNRLEQFVLPPLQI